MKKLIILITFFITGLSIGQVQDGYNQTLIHYQNVNNKLTNLSIDNTRIQADSLMSNIETSYSYLRTIDKNNSIAYVYELNKDIAKRSNRITPEETIIITYNKDYNLIEIQGVFEDLLPIWQKIFIIDVDKTKVMNNYKYRDFINETLNINYRFSSRNNIWTIKKIK